MAKFCTACGAPLTEGAKFCEACGTPVEVPLEAAPAQPSAQVYQCPNCGGRLVFDAATGHLTCMHCGHMYEQGEQGRMIPLNAHPVEQAQTSHVQSVEDFLERAPWEVAEDGTANAKSYNCPACGAQVVADQSTVATSCPYCGNNMLVSGIATKENVPTWVLPFSVSKDEAESRMRQHFEHKWYLSRQFDASLEHMQGVYVPYHLYHMDVQGWADYVGYYETRDDEDHTTRHYYAIKRAGRASFERIPVDGSSKMPDGHMDAISPFNFGQMKAFSAEYVAGFLMEVADEDAQTCQPRAEQRAVNSFESDLREDARRERNVEGIDETVRHQTSVKLTQTESAVLPVWLMHCTWDDIQMLFAVNGETGKCVGDLPIDGKRRVATITVTALVSAAIAILAYIFLIAGDEDSWRFLVGAVVVVVVVTLGVDGYFRGQMHTAVEATNASMSYTSEGLQVTGRWRSNRSTTSKNKARRWLDQ